MIEKQEAAIIPADGEEFELTIACIDPMQMVRDDGHDPRGWRFNGSPVAPQTRCFQLVRAGARILRSDTACLALLALVHEQQAAAEGGPTPCPGPPAPQRPDQHATPAPG